MLRGDGRGGFVPVSVHQSQLLIMGDGKALAVYDGDEDGWPDLVATRNNSSALIFHNQRREGGNSFSVLLQGPRRNARGIGARIEVLMKNGGIQAAEVTAGGGYLSQSAARCFFGFSPENPPREIRVAWPSGQRSTQPWVSGQTAIRISEEEP